MINFIIQSGHFQLLIDPILQRLQSNRATSWSAIVELLSRNKIRPNSKILDALFEGAQKSQMLENLILSHSWQKYDSRFQALRDELRTRLHKGILRKKDILKEKLGFLANHRMIDEEERVLQILLGMFPQDPEIQAHQVGFQERWARNVLATSHADHSFAKMHSPPHPVE